MILNILNFYIMGAKINAEIPNLHDCAMEANLKADMHWHQIVCDVC